MGKLLSLAVLLAFVANTSSPQAAELVTKNQVVKSNLGALESKFNSLVARVKVQVDEMGRRGLPKNLSLSIDNQLSGWLSQTAKPRFDVRSK